MTVIAFIKKNLLFLIITALFIVWLGYLIITSTAYPGDVYFHDVMTGGPIIDVSDQYVSQVPLFRYFIEPFVGLTFVFTFNSDPTEIIFVFIAFYAIFRGTLLIIDNTVLRKSEKKDIIWKYIGNALVFVVKYGSIMIGIVAGIVVVSLFTQGFLWVANHFSLLFHIAAIIGISLMIGKAIYNIIIYYRPKFKLKIKKKTVKNPILKGLVRFRRELFFFWTAFLFIFTFNFVFAGIKFPTQQITAIDLAPDEVLFDFHVHTIMSDGHLTPEQRVKWYMEQGFDGAVFTDHHHPWGAQRAKAYVEANNLDFTVLIGQEYTDDPEGLHLNLFGIEEAIIPENYYYEGPYHYSVGPGPMNVSEAINYTKTHGGYVIVNHYDWNASAPFTFEQLRDWGVDGFEVKDSAKYRQIYDFCIANNLIAISSTDQHMNNEADAFVRLKLTDPTNRTLDHIMENLHRNNHSSIIISKPSYYNDFNRRFNKLDDFNNYLANLDSLQLLSWIIWSGIAYALAVFFIFKVKKAKVENLREKIEYK